MNVIVNGGSRGIGREVALFLAQDINNQIIITGRNKMALEAVSELHPNIHPIEADLSHIAEQSQLFLEKIISIFDRIDALINMAGSLVSKGFMEIDESEAREMMEINFFGPASVIRVLRPLMGKGTHIVNISSMGGFQGSVKFGGLSYYSASKAAIACLSECLAAEFTDSGIRVNCLALGSVQTEMLQEAFPGYTAPVRASEIAPFISYFALNGHTFFNGKTIPVAVTNP